MNVKELIILKILLLFVLAFVSAQEKSAFAIANAIQSNMIIQQDKPFKVRGKAAAGDQITIETDWQRSTQVKTITGIPKPLVFKCKLRCLSSDFSGSSSQIITPKYLAATNSA